jgi:hypothetical protein
VIGNSLQLGFFEGGLRFFLTFSFLDVPLVDRGCGRDFSGNPGPLEGLRFFLTFFRLEVP